MASIKDKLWMWAHPVNSHVIYKKWYPEFPESHITPAEAAAYLDVPNLLMVRYGNLPAAPFEEYAKPLRSLKQVVWSSLPAIDVATGYSESKETDLDAVLALQRKQKNITGVVLDDFFGRDGKDAALTVEQLQGMQKKLQLEDKKLDLWAVYYDMLSGKTPPDEVVEPYLKECDIITHWTWSASNLVHLEESVDHVKRLADKCDCRVVLGCYMYDYGTLKDRKPMPVDLMKMQCELGLKWLEEGSIDGMIFLASCVCDLNFEAVEWTKNWISQLD